jgi:hypothetical protein
MRWRVVHCCLLVYSKSTNVFLSDIGNELEVLLLERKNRALKLF